MAQRLLGWGATAIVALALVACGGSSSNPAAPSPGTAANSDAAASGNATLKVSAPEMTSPADGEVLKDLPVTLKAKSASGTYVSTSLLYRFQVLTTTGTTIADSGRQKSLTYVVSGDLKAKAKYQWRVRAEASSGEFGPWSALRTFTTPDILSGYIRTGELFDPLTNGKTVGTRHGSITFMGTKGAKLNDFTSYISYRMPQPMTSGELSMIITNLEQNMPGSKTKVFGMAESTDNITVDPYRMTVDKRAGGQVAFRIITGDPSTDYSTDRTVVPFGDSRDYLWTFKWGGGRASLTIQLGENGNTILSKSVHYNGTYRPDPHMVFVGVPAGRNGPIDATAPGMIVRNVWMSTKPRPNFPN